MKLRKLTFLSVIIVMTILNLFAQNDIPTERKKALDYYKQGKYSEAISILQGYTKANKQDAEGFNLLGVSYLGLNKPKDGRKALEKAAKINPQDSGIRKNLAYAFLQENKLDKAISESTYALQLTPKNVDLYYIRGKANLWKGRFDEAVSDADSIITLDKQLSNAYLLKAFAYNYKFGAELNEGVKAGEAMRLLENSVTTLEECLKTCTVVKDLNPHTELRENTLAFIRYFEKHREDKYGSANRPKSKKNSKSKQAVATPSAETDPTVVPLKVLEKPKPPYTDSARASGVQGTIRVAVLFAANGKIAVIVLNPLSNGLTEQAVSAAQKIKFEPQQKDGKPVSVVKTVEYNFTLY